MREADFILAVCNRCSGGKLGEQLTSILQDRAQTENFRLESVACFAGCDRPLAVAFSASGKASYLFGDIDPANDVDALVSFGRLYRALPDGWSKESERPAGLRGKTLARIPWLAGNEASDG